MRPLVPELRFPEFKGPWKLARAGDAFRNNKAKGEAGLPIYSVTQDRGLVRRDSLERHMGADAADETNLRAQPGDLVYNMMRMWQGAVGRASEECMVSPAYVVLSPKKGVSSKFFDYWFQNRHMLHQLWAYSHGLTNDRLRLYYQDFAKIPLALPDQPEQEKIAAVLDATSRKIALLTDKKTALEDYKRGLMQRLFSRELRFTRDDGSAFPDWRKLPFQQLATRATDSFDPRSGFDTQPILIELENIESKTGRIISSVEIADQISLKTSFHVGDVLFGKLRPYLRKFARPQFDGICSSEIWVLKGRKVSSEFLFYLVQSERFIAKAIVSSSGSKMPRADWQTVADTMFWSPHPDEQRKIAATLSALDAKIDALSQKICEMEAFKKGLLQKLFV
ncbi:restriction endonuclease subunit S [Salipiger thiooxidans]|uniref:restriction endonuclease subunit S n=1 Tax=Salipiger thiooxidans TaxID=282683 RepID=UPI001CD2AC19|nr:restriction endonuclease subunit S [Salipiger thiooxidans]MCA0850246.1 restriction endonuclease subunit S [Salipiger thiooxidans]